MRTLKGLLLEMKLAQTIDERLLAEEEIINLFCAEKAKAVNLIDAANTLHDEVIAIKQKGKARHWDDRLENAVDSISEAIAAYQSNDEEVKK